jgi:hypothetical protein
MDDSDDGLLSDAGGERRVVYAEPDGWGTLTAKLVTGLEILAWCPAKYWDTCDLADAAETGGVPMWGKDADAEDSGAKSNGWMNVKAGSDVEVLTAEEW